jgi:hypothetical protein
VIGKVYSTDRDFNEPLRFRLPGLKGAANVPSRMERPISIPAFPEQTLSRGGGHSRR